ncbi:MAG: hypothetical protein K8J31_08930 [Anaerolineae bacterium]|nr:hypothetical protein [Anaerolineae bacterium]
MDTLALFISFFGGGVTSAIIVQIFALRSARKDRKLRLLEEQVRELYAPLMYLVMQSERLFELNRRFHDAYKVEFIDKKFSDNELTQERLISWANTTIDVANDYVKMVEVNNEKISALLDSKFSYIDPDDVELFLLFFEHRIRLTTERNDGGVLRTPIQIYDHVGEISYLRPEFIERVKSKFLSKKRELEKLLKR